MKTPSVVRLAVTLTAGMLFGLGLSVSGMIDPARVLGFLDVAGHHWDPSLLFVLGGAVATTVPFAAVIRRMGSPLLDGSFHLPPRGKVDTRLVAGSALFGAGWGLAGLCPGPAVSALTTGLAPVAIFVAAMVLGMVLNDRLLARALDRW